MSISLTINATDANDLRRQLSELLGAPKGVVMEYKDPVAAEIVRAASTKPKTTPKVEGTTAPAVEPEPEAEETQADDAGEQTEVVYTYDDHIKPSVLKVSAKHGRPGVEKLLSQFGVANAREVPEEKWPEFMAEIEKLLG